MTDFDPDAPPPPPAPRWRPTPDEGSPPCFLDGCDRPTPRRRSKRKGYWLYCSADCRAEAERRNRAAGRCRCGSPLTPGFKTCADCRRSRRMAARAAARHRRELDAYEDAVDDADLDRRLAEAARIEAAPDPS